MWRGLLVGCFVVALVVAELAVPPAASACSCAQGPTGVVRWPRDGAMDVPTDTPIVIWRYHVGGSTEEIGFNLTASDGTEVALSETLRIPPPWEGCGQGETLFLRPVEPLEPGATYGLAISPDADMQGQWGSTFTVGNEAFDPEGAAEPDTIFLRSELDPCVLESCRFAQVRVDFGAPLPMPRWVVLASEAPETAMDTVLFSPAEWEPMGNGLDAWDFAVALPDGDDCATLRIYGVEGRPLFDELRCEPDACARTAIRTGSTCGDPPRPALELTRVPLGHCDDPLLIEWKEGEGLLYPQAIDGSSESSMDAGGCSIAPAPRSAPPPWFALATALAWRATRPLQRRAPRGA